MRVRPSTPLPTLALVPLAAAWLVGCAGVAPDGQDGADLAIPVKPADLAVRRDLTLPPPPDFTVLPDFSCMLGVPDHCGRCDRVCPPGMDDDGTARSCSGPGESATCDIVCKGEFYDVNGLDIDGCESQDLPVQDSAGAAVRETLPDVYDQRFQSNPLNLLGYIAGDARTHAEAPLARPRGREDWYAIDALGKGDLNDTMKACLSINSLPADNEYEVCISDPGQAVFLMQSCASAFGKTMNSACVTPPGKGDAGVSYYVRVRKVGGAASTNGYALFLTH